MTGFADQVRAFGRGTGIALDKVVRKVVIDMTSGIVKLTPVDTGLARSNWFWGTNKTSQTEETTSKNGSPSVKRAMDFAGTIKGGGVFYIFNNLPYAMALEYGHSQQAPAGMARITVARWQGIVNAVVGGL